MHHRASVLILVLGIFFTPLKDTVAAPEGSECTKQRMAEILERMRTRATNPIADYQLVHYQGTFTLRARSKDSRPLPQYTMIQRPYIRLRPDCSDAQVAQLGELLATAFPSLSPLQARSFARAARERNVYLQELLPRSLQLRLNERAPCDGPNCWNATLVWFQSGSTRVEYTELDDIEAFLALRTYELRENAPLRTGDIFVVRRLGNLTHTAVYIEGDILFHKPGLRAYRRWVFDTLENMLATYLYDEYCTLEVHRRR